MANPFAALVSTDCDKAPDQNKLSVAIEDIFRLTVDRHKPHLVYVDPTDPSITQLDFDLLELVLFERLLFDDPKSVDGKVIYEKHAISYLYSCWDIYTTQYLDADMQRIEDIIVLNMCTALQQPELFDGQDLVLQLYKEASSRPHNLIAKVYDALMTESESSNAARSCFTSLLNMIHLDLQKCSFHNLSSFEGMDLLMFYTSRESLATLFMEYIMPKQSNVAALYVKTLFGTILNKSILPKNPYELYEHFREIPAREQYRDSLHITIKDYQNKLSTLVIKLMKCSATKAKILCWIGSCLEANLARNQVSNQMLIAQNTNTVNDGFALNLCYLLVKLIQPLCSRPDSEKILMVDSTYCGLTNAEVKERDLYMGGLSKETCLLPREELIKPLVAEDYNFATQMFFLTHRSFELSFKVMNVTITHTMRDLHRISSAMRSEAINGTWRHNHSVEQLQKLSVEFYSKIETLKCALGEPEFLANSLRFISATCYWLSQVTLNDGTSSLDTSHYYPAQHVSFDYERLQSSANPPDTLRYVPELIVENVNSFIEFSMRHNDQLYTPFELTHLEHYLNFILTFMGSSKYLKNPHLRASLAAGFQLIFPNDKRDSSGSPLCTQIIKSHPFRHKIVEALIGVFVSIEMTGESVQFELKFSYRQPMYAIMKHLWQFEDYRADFAELAAYAEQNMNNTPQPLFLRFVNLLVNDAIFLLDEALSNMSKLKELEAKKDGPEWETMSAVEKKRLVEEMEGLGQLARFDNLLGKETINMLERLTSHILAVFTHRTMVDRVAAMLNYFLLKLVGPNRTEFKVKNMSLLYSFKPAATVLNICRIYINLGANDDFCLAVSQDGRSYKPELFVFAEAVLAKIQDGGQLIGELQELAAHVARRANEQKTTEDTLGEIPEHFLDPIMSTLMTDPVILPSSKQTVDRQTIARHLLSDQTDPFNRSFLTLDLVVPDVELRQEIEAWLREKKVNIN